MTVGCNHIAEPMVHLQPHWTWPGKEGVAIPVWCYTNGDEAELFLNGESLGKRVFDANNDMHLEWIVSYQPGELKVVATMSHHTAGAPVKFYVSTDQTALDPANRDLAYLMIRVEDENGNSAPKAVKWVNIQIEGPGRLLGAGGGDPLSHTPFQANTFRTFNGLGRAIIAAIPGPDPEIRPGSTRKPGEILVRVNSRGMESVELRLTRTGEGMVSGAARPPAATAPAGEAPETAVGVDGLPTAK